MLRRFILDTNKCPVIQNGEIVELQHVWFFTSTNTTFLTISLRSDNKVVSTIKGTIEDCLMEVFPLDKKEA